MPGDTLCAPAAYPRQKMKTKSKGIDLLFVTQMWSSLCRARLFDTWAGAGKAFLEFMVGEISRGLV